MNKKVLFRTLHVRFLIIAATAAFTVGGGAHAQDASLCPGELESSLKVDEIVANGIGKCCSIQARKKRKKCFSERLRALQKIRHIVSVSVADQAKVALREAAQSQCSNQRQTVTEDCNSSRYITFEELSSNIEDRSCDKKYKTDRRKSLKVQRRSLKKAKTMIGSELFSDLSDTIRALNSSDNCGAGGKKKPVASSCRRIASARDGKDGNVYKMSDHGGLPVFVTHNGARSGTAVTKSGKLLDRLDYTGLGNKDGRGLRHHYRFNVRCSTLPSGFFINLGGTCYQIDSPCGRVD